LLEKNDLVIINKYVKKLGDKLYRNHPKKKQRIYRISLEVQKGIINQDFKYIPQDEKEQLIEI